MILELCSLGDLKKYLVVHRLNFVNEILSSSEDTIGGFQLASDNVHNPMQTDEDTISTSQLTCWAYQIAMGMKYLSFKRVGKLCSFVTAFTFNF